MRVVGLVGCKDFSSSCWLVSDREVVWEVTPIGLLVWGVGRFFFHVGEFLLSQRVFLSLTELTDLTEHICALFRAHRTPSAYRVHRALLLKMAVRFCEIGWLNVSVALCVFCSSVIFCEKKNNCETRWWVFSLTELTDLTDPFCAQFRSHRRPPAYRVHRAFQLS